MRSLKRSAGLAVLLSCSLAFSLAVAEVAIRLLYKRPPYTDAQIHIRSDDSELLYVLAPGAIARQWGTTISINSLGFRDDEPVPSLERRRIAVLGDSVTFGWKVAREVTFVERLERMLGGSADVMNLGVSGYNTGQEVRLFETVASRLKPDLVILVYCMNDPDRFTGDHVRHFHPPRFELGYYGGRAFDKLYQQFTQLEYHHYVHERWGGELPAHFERLRRVAEELDVTVVVAILPVFDWTEDGYAYQDLHTFVDRQAKSAGFAVVDLYPGFSGHAAGEVRLDIWHPNSLGHQLIATRLAERLRSLGLLP